jgi:N-acetylneuraminic acid mutarotase
VIKSYSLTTNGWTSVGEFTLAGRPAIDTMSVVGDSVFITAGSARSPIRIDLAALQYTSTGMESSPNSRTSSAAAVELNGKVYCFGGRGVNSSGNAVSYRRESEFYDTAADAWTVIPKLLVAREAATAVALDGKLYVIGGRTSDGGKSARVEVYTP